MAPGVSSKHRSDQGGTPKVDAPQMLPRCLPDPRCPQGASHRCLADGSQIPDAIQMLPTDASQMPPRCFPDASQMFPICFPDPRCPPNASHAIQILPRWVLSLKLSQMVYKCLSKKICLGSRVGVLLVFQKKMFMNVLSGQHQSIIYDIVSV